jgi:hypothetical protein
VARAFPKLVSFCSVLFLLVCVAVGVLWVRSYLSGDLAAVAGSKRAVSLHSVAGGLTITYAFHDGALPPGVTWSPQPLDLDAGLFGRLFTFGVRKLDGGNGVERQVAFPHWVTCATGLIPFGWLKIRRLWREYQNLPTSHCVKCGHILRDVGMCPNCRTPVGGFIA